MRLHIPIYLRWSDFDAYAHVNNAEMLHLLEEARIMAFWTTDDGGPDFSPTAVLDARPGADTLTIIARQEIEYLVPIPYIRRPLDLELWMGRLGGSSLEICYEIYAPVGTDPRTLFVKASTTAVLIDAKTDRPRRISDEQRVAWEPYLEDPVVFTRR